MRFALSASIAALASCAAASVIDVLPILNVRSSSSSPSSSVARRDNETHTLGKRVKDCIDLRGSVGTAECNDALEHGSIRHRFYFNSAKFGKPNKNSKLSDYHVVLEAPHFTTGGWTCDHILELNLLKDIINEDNGVCDEAAKLDAAEAKEKLNKVRNAINDPNNLVFFTDTVESVKTSWTTAFNKGHGETYDAQGKKVFMMVVADYIDKTKTYTMAVAHNVEKVIAEEFPDAKGSSLVTKWTKYIAEVKVAAALAKKGVEKQIEKAQSSGESKKKEGKNRKGGCESGPSAPPAPPASPPPSRMRRSLFPVSGLVAASSQYERRQLQTSRRTGPKAPAAPSCPLKKGKPKTKVPRSKTKTRQPKKKPRVPTQKPKTKAPKPKKKVKRPATRPRRPVGQKKPKTRKTPKRQPRKVPRPKKKTRGKPRPVKSRRRHH